WRKFPSTGDQAPPPAGGGWYEATTTLDGRHYFRPIDLAFPVFHHLECEAIKGYALQGTSIKEIGLVQGAAVAEFLMAFYAAWKTNAERALNGQNALPDWQVLLHVLRLWNRTHESTTEFAFEPASAQDRLQFNQPCPDSLIPYVATLTNDVIN